MPTVVAINYSSKTMAVKCWPVINAPRYRPVAKYRSFAQDNRRITVRRDIRVKTRPRIYYRPNYRVRTLPRNYTRIVVRDKIYFYFSGIFYWPSDIGYVVINAPVGATVAYLPTGYISFYLGPRRYFYVNLTYFLRLPDTRQYVVVEKPLGADEAIAKTSATDLVIYPKKGQSNVTRTVLHVTVGQSKKVVRPQFAGQ